MSKIYHLTQFTRPQATRSMAMRGLNALGRLAPDYRRISADALWAAAAKGLGATDSDGVEPDAAACSALQHLVDSINGSAELNLIGRFAAFDDSKRMARNHLRIQSLLRSQPSILETALPAPIFVIGLPRTGTTYLHTLLAQDPRHRTIPYWESFEPIPPATGPDTRIERLTKMLGQMDQIAPNYQAIHPMTAQSTEECVALFMNNFRTMQFDIQYRVPEYIAWLQTQDASIAYQGYLQQLKIIQHFRPTGEHFILKDPSHTLHLPTILDVFPNAKFVFTHRDPARSVSSICSLYAHTRTLFSDAVDAHSVGREILNGYWPTGLTAAMAFRDALPSERYADVRQRDLRENPCGAIEGVYEQLGLSFDEAAQAALNDYLAHAARLPKHRHEHSPEGFGLTGAQIRDHMRGYVERFDV